MIVSPVDVKYLALISRSTALVSFFLAINATIFHRDKYSSHRTAHRLLILV